jgi:predicted RNase H-like HicB family nuclease
MSTIWYWAIIEHHDGEYFVSLPDLPGPTAADPDHNEALRLVAEFSADHVADLVARNGEVPKARNAEDIERDPDIHEWGRALVPVDIPGKSVKVTLSMDEALLKRVDQAASTVGESRSGYFAAAAQQRMRGARRNAKKAREASA